MKVSSRFPKTHPRPPGFRDVAEKAGVSLTTVERVLNERGTVSPTTRLKVLEAAESLRLRRVLPSPNYGNVIIEAVLPDNPTAYWAKLSNALKEASQFLPRGITIHRTFVPENNPEAIIASIERTTLKRAALIIAAEIDDEIDRSLAGVIDKGEIVVSVSTTEPGQPLHVFSGIDNYAAGQTAASLINLSLRHSQGTILVIQGTINLQSHRDRVAGFIKALRPGDNLEVIVVNESPGASNRYLSAMLRDGRNPVAIYETGDSGDEIAPILRSLTDPPIWIGHERNDVHDALLREGLLHFVIDQDPQRQAWWAVAQILQRIGIENSKFSEASKPELRLFCATMLEAFELQNKTR